MYRHTQEDIDRVGSYISKKPPKCSANILT